MSIFNKVCKRGTILIRFQATEFNFNFGSHSFAELKQKNKFSVFIFNQNSQGILPQHASNVTTLIDRG